jgi:hypothetical protein
MGGGHGLDWCGLGQGQGAGTCGCDNDTSGSVECGEFLDWLRNVYLLKKDCSHWSK